MDTVHGTKREDDISLYWYFIANKDHIIATIQCCDAVANSQPEGSGTSYSVELQY